MWRASCAWGSRTGRPCPRQTEPAPNRKRYGDNRRLLISDGGKSILQYGGGNYEHSNSIVADRVLCVGSSVNVWSRASAGDDGAGRHKYGGDEVCHGPASADVRHGISPKGRPNQRSFVHPREGHRRLYFPLALAYTE